MVVVVKAAVGGATAAGEGLAQAKAPAPVAMEAAKDWVEEAMVRGLAARVVELEGPVDWENTRREIAECRPKKGTGMDKAAEVSDRGAARRVAADWPALRRNTAWMSSQPSHSRSFSLVCLLHVH